MTVLIFIYLGALTAFSIFFIGKSRSDLGYFVCDRKLKTGTLAFTLAATTTGGSAVVVTYALIKKYGALGILPDIAGGAGLIALSIFLSKKVYDADVITLPSLLKKTFRREVVLLLTFAIVLSQLAWLALSFKTLQITGSMGAVELAGVGALAFIYSCTGGQWAVSRSDIFQFLLMVAGFVYTMFIAEGTSIADFSALDLHLIYIVCLMFFSHMVGPDIYSKIFSAESDKAARNGAMLAGFMKAGFSLLILAAFIKNVSVQNLNGLLFIGIASAILSSIDSIIISSTAIISEDIFQMKESGIYKYIIGAVMVGLSILLALYSKEAVALLAAGYTVFLVILFFPLISILLVKTTKADTVIIPLTVFLFCWYIMGKEAAFLASFFAGGGLIAYKKIYS